ncbi:MAG: DNA-binding response regulator [Verrucomicrobiales bacterium]|nr:DNA-binding response regulator [Verrucomicrobiales bacterium]
MNNTFTAPKITHGARILIIEDEMPMRTVLGDALTRQGYRVLVAADGSQGLEMSLAEQPDLVVLDVMMPKLDGFEVCRELRRMKFKKPILLLTAKSEIQDRVKGLDSGGDDYLPKPFSREELLARIRALLRRGEREHQAQAVVLCGPVRIDLGASKVFRGNDEVMLTAKEFGMLRLMAEIPGQIISRDQFLDIVWGYSVFPSTRTVDKHIVTLRTKLGDDAEQPRLIKTVHGRGYLLEVSPVV